MSIQMEPLLDIITIQKVCCIALMSLESIDGLDVGDHDEDRTRKHENERYDTQEADGIQAHK